MLSENTRSEGTLRGDAVRDKAVQDKAVREGNLLASTLQWIEANGFNPADINAPGNHHDTPLILACRRGERAIAEELMAAGADINHRNMDGTTALWACVVSDSVQLARLLLDRGADIDHQNDNGATTLMYAASAGKTGWVEFFLENGADIRLQSLDDFTALDLASNIECLRLLKAARGNTVKKAS